eukprot:583601-Pleurochrysis_carterae.AAC.1
MLGSRPFGGRERCTTNVQRGPRRVDEATGKPDSAQLVARCVRARASGPLISRFEHTYVSCRGLRQGMQRRAT